MTGKSGLPEKVGKNKTSAVTVDLFKKTWFKNL